MERLHGMKDLLLRSVQAAVDLHGEGTECCVIQGLQKAYAIKLEGSNQAFFAQMLF